MAHISILHLEDDELDAELVSSTLASAGFTPSITRVATEEAFRAALDGNRFDLVIADYSLPSFDGLSALTLLRGIKHETPFILVSGALGEEVAIDSLKRGATDYVLKHRLERLVPAVERALVQVAERDERRRIESEKERLVLELAVAYEREHRIAESLQRSFLNKLAPGRFPSIDLATIYQAAWDEAQVGGDYYDYFALPNGRVAMVVGDVSGKGLIAAERTAQLKYTLRAYLREHDRPTVAVTLLNDFLCDESKLDEDETEYFVVLTLIVMDPSAGAAELVIAGADPALIIRTHGGVEEAKAGGLPLGVLEGARYASVTVALRPGDILMTSTDGITEARCGSAFLGLGGLARIAGECRAECQTLQGMGACILTKTQAYAGGELKDDACLLLARFKST